MKALSVFILLVLSHQVYADTDRMNVTLSRIDHILQQTYPLINQAEKQQSKQVRVQFQFEKLRQDIGKVQAGIEAQLHRVAIQPRQVTPLAGDYLTNQATS